jgi:hypothetical protein
MRPATASGFAMFALASAALAGEFLDKVSSLFFTIGVTLHW